MSNYDRALARAADVFGDEKRAALWLEKMSGTFGKSPREVLADEDGIKRVLRHIRSVELALDTD